MTVIQPIAEAGPPANASGTSRHVTVRIVEGFDDLQKVFAVRAAVFLGKPGWSYAHTFDANDFCATHILGEIDGEPAGTVRVRWFEGFARIERVAIREDLRSLALLNGLARKALRLCRSKGYKLVSGLTYPQLVNFWRRHGGETSGGEIPSDYGGNVVPMVLRTEKITDITPPDVSAMGTPEFEWEIFKWEGHSV